MTSKHTTHTLTPHTPSHHTHPHASHTLTHAHTGSRDESMIGVHHLGSLTGYLLPSLTPLLGILYPKVTTNLCAHYYYITILTDLFQKLFRQDLLVASMFRNFLLAERIMRTYKCSPESHPPIPSTYNHPMWAAWDLALDHIARQLPDLVENKAPYEVCPYEVPPPLSVCVPMRYPPTPPPPPSVCVCVTRSLSLSFSPVSSLHSSLEPFKCG